MKEFAIRSNRSDFVCLPGEKLVPMLGEPLYKVVLYKVLRSKIFDRVIVATDESAKVIHQSTGLEVDIYQRSVS